MRYIYLILRYFIRILTIVLFQSLLELPGTNEAVGEPLDESQQRLLDQIENPDITPDVRESNYDVWEDNLVNAIAVAEDKLKAARADYKEIEHMLVALYSRVSD